MELATFFIILIICGTMGENTFIQNRFPGTMDSCSETNRCRPGYTCCSSSHCCPIGLFCCFLAPTHLPCCNFPFFQPIHVNYNNNNV
uniref:Cysteine rich secreted protein n=1 Tax=Riptortus pedestris TaxID=329032 RepID=R4WIY2_RIPPE|nr:cysteine rich secreted protein [Riptortus pedestris]